MTERVLVEAVSAYRAKKLHETNRSGPGSGGGARRGEPGDAALGVATYRGARLRAVNPPSTPDDGSDRAARAYLVFLGIVAVSVVTFSLVRSSEREASAAVTAETAGETTAETTAETAAKTTRVAAGEADSEPAPSEGNGGSERQPEPPSAGVASKQNEPAVDAEPTDVEAAAAPRCAEAENRWELISTVTEAPEAKWLKVHGVYFIDIAADCTFSVEKPGFYDGTGVYRPYRPGVVQRGRGQFSQLGEDGLPNEHVELVLRSAEHLDLGIAFDIDVDPKLMTASWRYTADGSGKLRLGGTAGGVVVSADTVPSPRLPGVSKPEVAPAPAVARANDALVAEAKRLTALGSEARRKGNGVLARTYFERALEKDAKNRDAARQLAVIDKELARASNTSERATAGASSGSVTDLQSLVQRGLRAYKAEKYATAIKAFEQVLAASPDNSLAKRYLRLSRQAQSNPGDPKEKALGHIKTGLQAYKAKDYLEAERELSRAIRLDPSNKLAQKYLDLVRSAQGVR